MDISVNIEQFLIVLKVSAFSGQYWPLSRCASTFKNITSADMISWHFQTASISYAILPENNSFSWLNLGHFWKHSSISKIIYFDWINSAERRLVVKMWNLNYFGLKNQSSDKITTFNLTSIAKIEKKVVDLKYDIKQCGPTNYIFTISFKFEH